MDVLALAAVIVAGVGAASTGINAFYNTRRTAKTAREGRAEQRAADGYLKVLSLAKQEAQWHEAVVFNLGLDPQELAWGSVETVEVPAKPGSTDRATAAALIAAFASEAARTSHAAWRESADAVHDKVKWIGIGLSLNAEEHVPDEWMKELTDDLQPKEREARKALAEAVAHELGHRVAQRQGRLSGALGRIRSRGGRSVRARHGASPQGD